MKNIHVQLRDISYVFQCDHVERETYGLAVYLNNKTIAFFQIWDFWIEIINNEEKNED